MRAASKQLFSELKNADKKNSPHKAKMKKENASKTCSKQQNDLISSGSHDD